MPAFVCLVYYLSGTVEVVVALCASCTHRPIDCTVAEPACSSLIFCWIDYISNSHFGKPVYHILRPPKLLWDAVAVSVGTLGDSIAVYTQTYGPLYGCTQKHLVMLEKVDVDRIYCAARATD